ncbi:MAG: immunoglobulin domain-containing protein, partial [Asticcacaulis sp.]
MFIELYNDLPTITATVLCASATPPPSITGHPSSSTIAAGTNTSFSVTASNATGYQWHVNMGAGFTPISNGGVYSGATSSTLTITGATAGMNGYMYRAVASGAGGADVTSTGATLTVNSPPSIISQPAASTIAAGANTTFSVIASNATSYQWQVDQGAGYTNVGDDSVYSG